MEKEIGCDAIARSLESMVSIQQAIEELHRALSEPLENTMRDVERAIGEMSMNKTARVENDNPRRLYGDDTKKAKADLDRLYLMVNDMIAKPVPTSMLGKHVRSGYTKNKNRGVTRSRRRMRRESRRKNRR